MLTGEYHLFVSDEKKILVPAGRMPRHPPEVLMRSGCFMIVRWPGFSNWGEYVETEYHLIRVEISVLFLPDRGWALDGTPDYFTSASATVNVIEIVKTRFPGRKHKAAIKELQVAAMILQDTEHKASLRHDDELRAAARIIKAQNERIDDLEKRIDDLERSLQRHVSSS